MIAATTPSVASQPNFSAAPKTLKANSATKYPITNCIITPIKVHFLPISLPRTAVVEMHGQYKSENTKKEMTDAADGK